MVIECGNHKFEIPKRSVLLPSDVKKWEHSNAYQDILGFLTAMNKAVGGKKLSAECVESPVTTGLLKMLDTLSQWIDGIPPVDQPQRFGNTAFRDFYYKLKENSEQVVKEALPEEFHAAVPEIAVYLVESVGNSTRIDYGTGHELSFIMFLTCIFKIGALKQEDSIAVVTKIFNRYLSLSRKLQMIYKMEPAGSQGVWSLDDYQFLPFIWGSSQLQMHPKISPEMFVNEKIVNENADEYMFFSCIKFILSVKTGPFAEHSNQLWNISGVQSWSKINQGLIKMYKAEVLHKFPVVQHMLFGTILSISPATEITFLPPGSDMPSGRMSQIVGRQGFMPPGVNPMPVYGATSAVDEMVKSMPRLGRTPQDIPYTEKISSGMSPVSKQSQELNLENKIGCGMDSSCTKSTDVPCIEKGHPTVPLVNSLPPGTFQKQNTSTGVTSRESPNANLK
ncbi:serine/threonine-protein phosphatase 2A activator-like [Panulirus ornatus]|uniref:serine/threonine-protein phosphatase 2A activator-like n=1 Tax=Panulirus ornatus TaxID=150431 RepID=UPI003A8AB895